MLRRIMTRILDIIETVIHFLDTLTLSPNPFNKFDNTNRPSVDPKTIPYRTRPWDPYRRPWNG
jgi:hypothetical protein